MWFSSRSWNLGLLNHRFKLLEDMCEFTSILCTWRKHSATSFGVSWSMCYHFHVVCSPVHVQPSKSLVHIAANKLHSFIVNECTLSQSVFIIFMDWICRHSQEWRVFGSVAPASHVNWEEVGGEKEVWKSLPRLQLLWPRPGKAGGNGQIITFKGE